MNYSECSICSVTDRETRLLDAVSLKEKGVVKVCDSCAKKEGLPVLRRPTTFQLKESEKNERVYRRPSSGRVYGAGGYRASHGSQEKEKVELGLRDIVDRNYEKKVSGADKGKLRPELVDNFHWVIMRARRAKKITHEQMAKEISESVAAIKMAEQGILPDDDYILVNKIESFLAIKIVKGDLQRSWKPIDTNQPARIIKFDPLAMKNLTIDDLKKIKEEKEKAKGFYEDEGEMDEGEISEEGKFDENEKI